MSARQYLEDSYKFMTEVQGRVWREADVGLIGDMSRAKSPRTFK
ncbi:hypothetical protein [Enterococcus moraviensis]